MLNRAKTGLILFDNFFVDENLPKHAPPEDVDSSEFEGNSSMTRPSRFRFSRRNLTLSQAFGDDEIGGEWEVVEKVEVPAPPPQEWWRRLGIAFGLLKPSPPLTEEHRMSVQEFFTSVKGGVKDISLVSERALGYRRALNEARRAGQKALEERLQEALEAVRAETQLLDIGVTSYVEEATLVEFVKKAPRGVRLDWLSNFTRQVPVEIIDRKEECDRRLTFDNYAVLHYDPEGKGAALTRQEEEDRKDPILFGLFQGQRKLYPIGDWVDEHCNLTLDEMATILGRRPEVEIPVSFSKDSVSQVDPPP